MVISLESKKEIFNLIVKSETDFLGDSHEDFQFLKEIWDIRNMPSEDNRFPNAERDIWQHIVNNSDWDLDYLFIERLKLYENDDIFIKFVETAISPTFRKGEDDIFLYVLQINEILIRDKLQLSIFDYNNIGVPIYKVFNKEDVENTPIDIKKITYYFL